MSLVLLKTVLTYERVILRCIYEINLLSKKVHQEKFFFGDTGDPASRILTYRSLLIVKYNNIILLEKI